MIPDARGPGLQAQSLRALYRSIGQPSPATDSPARDSAPRGTTAGKWTSTGDLHMSIQATVESQSMYHVVGRRATGDRIIISESDNLDVAEKILSLMSGADYTD